MPAQPRPRRVFLPAAMFLAACAVARPALLAQSPAESEFVPVTDAMLQAPAPGDWPMWRRTLDGWGFRSDHAVKYCNGAVYGFVL